MAGGEGGGEGGHNLEGVMVEPPLFDIYLCDNCDAELYSLETYREHESSCIQEVLSDSDDVIFCDDVNEVVQPTIPDSRRPPAPNYQRRGRRATATQAGTTNLGDRSEEDLNENAVYGEVTDLDRMRSFLLNFQLRDNNSNNVDPVGGSTAAAQSRSPPKVVSTRSVGLPGGVGVKLTDKKKRVSRRSTTFKSCPTVPISSPMGVLLMQWTPQRTAVDFEHHLSKLERNCPAPALRDNVSQPKWLQLSFREGGGGNGGETVPCTYRKVVAADSQPGTEDDNYVHLYKQPRRQFSQRSREESHALYMNMLVGQCKPFSIKLPRLTPDAIHHYHVRRELEHKRRELNEMKERELARWSIMRPSSRETPPLMANTVIDLCSSDDNDDDDDGDDNNNDNDEEDVDNGYSLQCKQFECASETTAAHSENGPGGSSSNSSKENEANESSAPGNENSLPNPVSLTTSYAGSILARPMTRLPIGSGNSNRNSNINNINNSSSGDSTLNVENSVIAPRSFVFPMKMMPKPLSPSAHHFYANVVNNSTEPWSVAAANAAPLKRFMIPTDGDEDRTSRADPRPMLNVARNSSSNINRAGIGNGVHNNSNHNNTPSSFLFLTKQQLLYQQMEKNNVSETRAVHGEEVEVILVEDSTSTTRPEGATEPCQQQQLQQQNDDAGHGSNATISEAENDEIRQRKRRRTSTMRRDDRLRTVSSSLSSSPDALQPHVPGIPSLFRILTYAGPAPATTGNAAVISGK